MEFAKKFLSRKFLVAIAAVLAALQNEHLHPWHVALIGVVAIVYIAGEALIDREGVIMRELERGLEVGRDAVEAGSKAEELAGTLLLDAPAPAPTSTTNSSGPT